MNHAIDQSFLMLFETGDFDSAKALLQRQPELAHHSGYEVHTLLREFVDRNDGHCYKRPHLLIADLLIRDQVRSFRDAVLEDRIDDVRDQLRADSNLVSAEFTAGRGIAQGIHHWRSIAVGKHLLDAGADIDTLTTVHHIGETPLAMQLRFGTVAGTRLLLERGANPNRGLIKYMPSTSMPILIKLLLDHGWDINEGAGGQTLLHHDANHGHGSKVRILLDHGADPTIQDVAGRTSLHLIAARGVGGETIRAMVKAGADVNARDNEGNTPLDLARLAKRQAATKELIVLGVNRSRCRRCVRGVGTVGKK